jgi:hypothetical protein
VEQEVVRLVVEVVELEDIELHFLEELKKQFLFIQVQVFL